jgi:hypothetical protein
MICPKCDGSHKLNQRSDQRRPAEFLTVALVIFGVGAALHYFAVAMWPWVVYAVGAFVLLQAVIAWFDCKWGHCPGCNHTMYVWPWLK